MTLNTDYGWIFKTITYEDLLENPEIAGILESEEWKIFQQENPEEAEKMIKGLLAEGFNKVPWNRDLRLWLIF